MIVERTNQSINLRNLYAISEAFNRKYEGADKIRVDTHACFRSVQYYGLSRNRKISHKTGYDPLVCNLKPGAWARATIST